MTLERRAVPAVPGGHAVGGTMIFCPGPGRSAGRRSLAVRLDPTAPGGFLVHGHAGGRACRDHVRALLLLAEDVERLRPSVPSAPATLEIRGDG